MSLSGLFRDKEGHVRADQRTSSGRVYVVETVIRVVGGLFTVCFPLAVMLLYGMSKDIHTMAEKISAVVSTQMAMIDAQNKSELALHKLESDTRELAERTSAVEQQIADHTRQDNRRFRSAR